MQPGDIGGNRVEVAQEMGHLGAVSLFVENELAITGEPQPVSFSGVFNQQFFLPLEQLLGSHRPGLRERCGRGIRGADLR